MCRGPMEQINMGTAVFPPSSYVPPHSMLSNRIRSCPRSAQKPLPLRPPTFCVSGLPTVRCSPISSQEASPDENFSLQNQHARNQHTKEGLWKKWKENSSEMSAKLAKLGLAAVLAYGLFDGVTYTSFFVLAFLGYEKSTGKNPAANLQALLGIVILMWTGNNITRPFRVAGAAALAPVIDEGLRRIQKYFNFPNLLYAFALVAAMVTASCLTVVGLLIVSRRAN